MALTVVLGSCGNGAWATDAQHMFRAAQRLGPQAVQSLPSLQAMLQHGAGLEPEAQLTEVNAFFNRRVVFVEDHAVWGQTDHWASPLELLAAGRGDCEDYAIAKYFSLLVLGMPVSKLRLVYAQAQIGGQSRPHMVLAYYAHPDAEPLILDNLLSDLRPASRRPDLRPVFSFNSHGLWQGVAGARAGEPQARLGRWRDVMAKARAEGFP